MCTVHVHIERNENPYTVIQTQIGSAQNNWVEQRAREFESSPITFVFEPKNHLCQYTVTPFVFSIIHVNMYISSRDQY